MRMNVNEGVNKKVIKLTGTSAVTTRVKGILHQVRVFNELGVQLEVIGRLKDNYLKIFDENVVEAGWCMFRPTHVRPGVGEIGQDIALDDELIIETHTSDNNTVVIELMLQN